jgi:hypothetical protein
MDRRDIGRLEYNNELEPGNGTDGDSDVRIVISNINFVFSIFHERWRAAIQRWIT